MILTGEEIKKQIQDDKIKVEPYEEAMVTTNALDVRLGTTLIRYTSDVLDPKKEPKYVTFEIPEEGYVLQKGDFVLGATVEKVGSDFFVPKLHGKSGTARKGLFVNVTADLINPGAHGTVTLQLYATLPVRLYPNMPIAQITFWVPQGEVELYKGRYQNSEGPIAYLPPQKL